MLQQLLELKESLGIYMMEESLRRMSIEKEIYVSKAKQRCLITHLTVNQRGLDMCGWEEA
uniref:Uncharacterized protein n=1 Tax=Romanomermis culicivorax TaxID=13658 RepID=A0A915IZY5_ROMCU